PRHLRQPHHRLDGHARGCHVVLRRQRLPAADAGVRARSRPRRSRPVLQHAARRRCGGSAIRGIPAREPRPPAGQTANGPAARDAHRIARVHAAHSAPDMKTLQTSHGADSPYAWTRLWVALALVTIGGAGMYSMAVVLPPLQEEFGIARADSSLPFTLTMIGFGLGSVLMGRL